MALMKYINLPTWQAQNVFEAAKIAERMILSCFSVIVLGECLSFSSRHHSFWQVMHALIFVSSIAACRSSLNSDIYNIQTMQC